MDTKYQVGDKIACAICCGGRTAPIPKKLLGEVIQVNVDDPTYPIYAVKLPNGMIDFLNKNTART